MMGLLMPTRRGFLMGLASLIAAPAVVHVASLMQIKGEPLCEVARASRDLLERETLASDTVRYLIMGNPIPRNVLWAEHVMTEWHSESFAESIDLYRGKEIKFHNGTVWKFK